LRSRPWIGFGILWFFLQLAPTNSLVPRLDVANDRQVYLACWGLFLALAVELALPKRAAVAVAASLAVVFAAFNVVRQLDYRDEISLWEASVREAPWNARARNNLGYAYYEAGRKDEALRELRAALFFDPQHAKAKANLALLVWD
jgi:tetratricopeptide (TPR) repeat protein